METYPIEDLAVENLKHNNDKKITQEMKQRK